MPENKPVVEITLTKLDDDTAVVAATVPTLNLRVSSPGSGDDVADISAIREALVLDLMAMTDRISAVYRALGVTLEPATGPGDFRHSGGVRETDNDDSITFNMNDQIRITLTPEGVDAWYANNPIPSWMASQCRIQEAGEPFVSQFWVMMQRIGPAISYGGPQLIAKDAVDVLRSGGRVLSLSLSDIVRIALTREGVHAYHADDTTCRQVRTVGEPYVTEVWAMMQRLGHAVSVCGPSLIVDNTIVVATRR